MNNVAPGPKGPSTAPASNGPNARPKANCMAFNRIALAMSARGTSIGTNEFHAGPTMPPMKPLTAPSPTMFAGVALPAIHTIHTAVPAAICASWRTRRRRRRSYRSTMALVHAVPSTLGRNDAAPAKPSHVLEPVSLYTM